MKKNDLGIKKHSFIKRFINRLKFYHFDSINLHYKRAGWKTGLIILSVCCIFFGAGVSVVYFNIKEQKINRYDEEQKLIIIKNGDCFSEEKLILFLNELNFRYPEIAYAQIRMETGMYNSPICKENVNYFGMKDARGPNGRINTQSGNLNAHATYQNWRMSVIDYAIYWSTYLSSLKTKEECYNYIENSYSETKGYVEKFKGFEKEYFEKINKITAKNSYDILN